MIQNFGGKKNLLTANIGQYPNWAKNIKCLKFQLHQTKNCLPKCFKFISLCNLSSHTISCVMISHDYWFYVHHLQHTDTSIKPMFSVEATVHRYNKYQNPFNTPILSCKKDELAIKKDGEGLHCCTFFSISNLWAGDKFAYGPLLWVSVDQGVEFSSLPMDPLAEESLTMGFLNSILH